MDQNYELLILHKKYAKYSEKVLNFKKYKKTKKNEKKYLTIEEKCSIIDKLTREGQH